MEGSVASDRSPQNFSISESAKMNSNSMNVADSYRSISSLKSDPKIIVAEPLDAEISSPAKTGAVYVTEEYEIGTRYEGYMLDNKRHGKGRFFYK